MAQVIFIASIAANQKITEHDDIDQQVCRQYQHLNRRHLLGASGTDEAVRLENVTAIMPMTAQAIAIFRVVQRLADVTVFDH